MENTLELNKLSDEQVEKELKELKGKKDATPEEKEKVELLKEERQTRYDKRIKIKDSERMAAEHRAKVAEEALATERQKREELESRNREVDVIKDTVEYGGKRYHTDKALRSMVDTGELTSDEAYEYQEERREAKVIERVRKETQTNNAESEEKRIRREDFEAMVREFPAFDANHPDHDPEDPLFKKANELWQDGLRYNPRGLTKAISTAKEILGHTKERPDLSNEHSVAGNRSGAGRAPAVTVSLDESEKEFYIRMYTMNGNLINPKTNKPYTEAEAIAKGMAMKARQNKK